MLRMHQIANGTAAVAYFAKSDSGAYYEGGLRQEWMGKGAELLGLTGPPEYEQFERLIHGYHPFTNEPLTERLVVNRTPGWDCTASVPKSVSLLLEAGDTRIQEAIWDAARETVADLETQISTRVRTGGRQEDRKTLNLLAYAVEHAETRPARCDGFPDPDRHLHIVILNATLDLEEQKWKAVKFQPVMEQRRYFDRRFDLRLSKKLADLGYSIRTEFRNGRYFTWGIDGIPKETLAKFSRRSAEIEALAEKLGITSPEGRDKLAATSRQNKRADLTLADCRENWLARTTPEEDRIIEGVIRHANLGVNPKQENTADKGMAYAVGHEFERRSVVPWTELAVSGMERAFGGAHPDQFEQEAKKQGVLFEDGLNGLVSTREVLAEESRVIDFAREGRGTMQPMGAGQVQQDSQLNLSAEQQALVKHVLASKDRLTLVEGKAGTGKTTADAALVSAIESTGLRVAKLAPTAAAAREVLRKDFPDADTLAAFRRDTDWQGRVQVVLLDEMPLASIKDVAWLCEWAQADPLRRVIWQGDVSQHHSPARTGNMFRVVQEHASLPVGRLTQIHRQKHDGYKRIVSDIARGERDRALEGLSYLGWVKQTDSHAPLVEEYLDALAKKKSVAVIAPTHALGDEITEAIRERLKAEGMLGQEKEFTRLVNLNWTDAQKGELAHYDGSEWLLFTRNSGSFSAGERIRVKDLKPGQHWRSPSHFAVYRETTIPVAVGDSLRIAGNGKAGDHRLNNGAMYTVKGFNKQGIVLNNGWTLAKDFGQIAHGYVSTSYASQGRTVDRVLVSMNRSSLPAVSAEQLYVSLSRGRESARLFHDMTTDELKQAVKKTDTRMSATEVFGKKPKKKQPRLVERVRGLLAKARDRFRQLHADIGGGNRDRQKQKEYDHER